MFHVIQFKVQVTLPYSYQIRVCA